jgi:transposase
MDHFAGLDVSVKETSVCIVDDTGRIAREVKVASGQPSVVKEVIAKRIIELASEGERDPRPHLLHLGLRSIDMPPG